MKTIREELLELKKEGVKMVCLNGWDEDIDFVLSLHTPSLKRLENGSYQSNPN